MSVVINTNFAATIAANNLATSSAMLQRSLNRLSSGTKIINPSDDAGGLAVSMKLSAAARRSAATNTNIANSTSFLQQQDGVLKTAGEVLNRMSELYTLYQDPTKNTSDKANYDTEFKALQSELSSLGTEKFNGIALFSSSAIDVKVSEDGSQTVTLAGKNLASTDTTVGLGSQLTAGTTSLSDVTSISTINTAIQNVATFRADNGSEQSRLGFASEVLTTNQSNLEAANSRIVDVDVAQESTQLARWNVLVQAGTSMLAQANQSAQSALKLIG